MGASYRSTVDTYVRHSLPINNPKSSLQPAHVAGLSGRCETEEDAEVGRFW